MDDQNNNPNPNEPAVNPTPQVPADPGTENPAPAADPGQGEGSDEQTV